MIHGPADLAVVCHAADPKAPDVEEILRRFLARAREAAEVESRQEICYLRKTRVEQLTEDGTVRESKSKCSHHVQELGQVKSNASKVVKYRETCKTSQ